MKKNILFFNLISQLETAFISVTLNRLKGVTAIRSELSRFVFQLDIAHKADSKLFNLSFLPGLSRSDDLFCVVYLTTSFRVKFPILYTNWLCLVFRHAPQVHRGGAPPEGVGLGARGLGGGARAGHVRLAAPPRHTRRAGQS